MLIVTPFARIASTCAGHCSTKMTSSPAMVRSAPIAAPFAPVPTIAIFRAAISVLGLEGRREDDVVVHRPPVSSDGGRPFRVVGGAVDEAAEQRRLHREHCVRVEVGAVG